MTGVSARCHFDHRADRAAPQYAGVRLAALPPVLSKLGCHPALFDVAVVSAAAALGTSGQFARAVRLLAAPCRAVQLRPSRSTKRYPWSR